MCWLLVAHYWSTEDGGGPRSAKRQADTLLVAPQLDLHIPAPLIHLAAATRLLLPSVQLHIMEDVASVASCDSVRASTETLNAPSLFSISLSANAEMTSWEKKSNSGIRKERGGRRERERSFAPVTSRRRVGDFLQ